MKVVFTLIFLFIIIALLVFALPKIFGGVGSPTSLIGGEFGVFASVDNGINWQEKIKIDEKKNIGRVEILDIVFDLSDDKTMWLGTNGNGLFKSDNSGETWQNIIDEAGILDKRAVVYQISIDPNNSDNIYLAVYQNNRGRVLKSVDNGKTFREVYIVQKDKLAVFSVKVDPYESRTVYIGTAEGGLFQSIDFAESWRLVRWLSGTVKDIVINPKNTREIYITTFENGIFKTTDKGNTWQDLNEGLKSYSGAKKVKGLALDPNNQSVLYLASDFGILKSADGGITFNEVKLLIPPEDLPINAIAVDTHNSNILYTAANSAFYKSQDGGSHWTVKKIPTNNKIGIIAINPKDSGNIFMGIKK